MEQVWDAVGLHHTYTGQNRDDAQSADSRVRKRYAKSNRKLFRSIIRQLDRDTIQAKAIASTKSDMADLNKKLQAHFL